MRFSSLAKLGSLLPVVTCLACLGALVSACDGPDGDGGDRGDYSSGPPIMQPSANPQQVAIDTGTTVVATAGGGVGVFVEYTAGGHWKITTACDTNTSGVSCGFDVFVVGVDPTKTTLSNPQGENLADLDTVAIQSDGSLHLSTTTGMGLGGLSFDATAGGAVELEMYLDGVIQPDFIYWIGGAVLHTGAPTDPVDFAPSAP
jgi:hypothetical protein